MSKPFTISDIKNSPVAHLNTHLLEEKPKKKSSKYRNQKVEFDDKIFDSIKERDRYITLRMLQTAGEISELQCQVEFILERNGKKLCSYIADYVYKDKAGILIVEDVKSSATKRLAVYRLKKKMMKEILGVEIREV